MKKKLYLCLLICVALFNKNALAQFSGQYAPANWTITLSNGTGSVNTSGAPSSIVLNGSDVNSFGSDVTVDYTIAAKASGPWSFSWSYSTSDGNGGADPAYVLINGVQTQLTDNSSPNQSDTYSGTVVAGDIIGFRVNAIDDCCGPGILTISSFSAPGSVLPVSLSNFSADISSGKLNVEWKTQSEHNNSHFTVHTSHDGQVWNEVLNVGSKAAEGNSSSVIEYSHAIPLTSLSLAGLGLLGLLFVPAARNRFARLGIILLVVSVLIACAKEKDGLLTGDEFSKGKKQLYVKLVQHDKDGKSKELGIVPAKQN